ncbi:MAG: NUDIX domain-containing protein [Magnetococcales bacterium]|nr:NUDIX domain-containing protein [Magnetococcales bacterium]
MSELLHATNSKGKYVKTMERSKLFKEIRNHSRKHGDANLAVPVIHVLLTTSNKKIRLVQRGDKPENPFMWDKAVGGHVVTDKKSLPRSAFDENAKKEMEEEIGISNVVIADDDMHYHKLLNSDKFEPKKQALIRMISHDYWQGTIAKVKDGEPWLKRSNVVVYAGVFDGPFKFMDGEAINQRTISRHKLMAEITQKPWLYADGARVFMQRYYYFL